MWLNARQQLKEKNFEEAEQTLDRGIFLLAQHAMQGVGDKDLIEGVKRETWLERFWISLENNIWPLREDYEEVWKFK